VTSAHAAEAIMPKYRLHPVEARTDEDDLTLEIANHRARIYSDEKVYHDWGYADCVDYVRLPGMEYNGSWRDWLSMEFTGIGSHAYSLHLAILIGSKVHYFVLSEMGTEALIRFWERGYLLRNPDAARKALLRALLAFGIGAAIGLGLLALIACVLLHGSPERVTVPLLLETIVLVPFAQGVRFWRRRANMQRIENELREEGVEVPHPATHEPYPPAKIDVFSGRAREE
jgi:hypothetical protein